MADKGCWGYLVIKKLSLGNGAPDSTRKDRYLGKVKGEKVSRNATFIE